MNTGSGRKRKAVRLTETERANMQTTGEGGTNDNWEIEEIQVNLQVVFKIVAGFVH